MPPTPLPLTPSPTLFRIYLLVAIAHAWHRQCHPRVHVSRSGSAKYSSSRPCERIEVNGDDGRQREMRGDNNTISEGQQLN